MKYEENTAKKIALENGLSQTTLRVWKNRGTIPDFWAKEKPAEKPAEKLQFVLPTDFDAEHASKMLFCILIKGAAKMEFRPVWERRKFHKEWREEFLAELKSAALCWKAGWPLKEAVKIMRKFCKIRSYSEMEDRYKVQTDFADLPNGLKKALSIYEVLGFPGIESEFPEAATTIAEKRKLRKALSSFCPKVSKYTREKIGESYADWAKAFSEKTGGEIRFTSRGSIYVETPDGERHRFADHNTNFFTDLHSNNVQD